MAFVRTARPLVAALAGLAAFAALSAGCGGGGSLGSGIVASVNGEEITQARLDEVIAQAKGRLEAQGQKIPAAGSAEYQAFQQNALQYLVQRIEYRQKAEELNVSVTEKQVDDYLERLKKQFFGGSDKRYQAALDKQAISEADVREEVRATLLSEAVFEKVASRATVTEKEIQQYYNANPQQYQKQSSRPVRHILVKSKPLADQIYTKLKAGTAFAPLAKKYSTDTGSKDIGGKYTAVKGQSVPQFDKVAFELSDKEISKPVKTRYGWHVIQALGPATKASSTPLAKVKDTIRETLVSQKKSEVVGTWLEGLKKEYAAKIEYAPGFAPPTAETTPTETSSR
jgi:foldase protein PrsA